MIASRSWETEGSPSDFACRCGLSKNRMGHELKRGFTGVRLQDKITDVRTSGEVGVVGVIGGLAARSMWISG